MNGNVIYFKDSGKIMAISPFPQSYTSYFDRMPEDFLDSLTEVHINPVPKEVLDDVDGYRIVNGELIKLSDLERLEFLRFDRILSENERLENQYLSEIEPSFDKIDKAKRTIEFIDLMSEVME